MRALKLTAVLVTASILAVTGGKATPARATTESVAIVVIDNFGLRPVMPKNSSSFTNCTYAPEDTNVVGDSGAGDDLPAEVSHGTAVQSRLSAELDDKAGLSRLPTTGNLAPYGLAGIPGISAQAERWAYGAQELMLIGMDTNGFTTAELASRIDDVTSALRLSPRGITRVVLNMSFVIVPCNVPAWLDGIGRFDAVHLLDGYRALIDAHPELTELRQELDLFPTDPTARRVRLLNPAPDDPLMPVRMLAAPGEFYGLANPNVFPPPPSVKQRLDSDPLRFLLSGLTATAPVVPVAAAGNGVRVYDDDNDALVRIRFAFPFAPALWDPVVSASGGDDPFARAAYSNNGEVVLDGRTQVTRADGGLAEVHGSSFAAPRLSASAAVYVLTGGPSPCDGHTPVLGYTNSDLLGQHWDDLPLIQAASVYCDGYLAHTNLV